MLTELETVRFGCFTLDTRRRTLLSSEKLVPLHARAFDILVYLVENRDRPVSHAEILAHVWSNRVVAENNLSVQLSSLRKALAEAGEPKPLILTLPERKYRFVGELERPEAPQFPEPSTVVEKLSPAGRVPPLAMAKPGSSRAFWLALSLAATLAIVGMPTAILVATRLTSPPARTPPRLSMVVLPFRNASPDRSQDYLADAITDDLTADLAHVPESTVIARESAEAVKKQTPQEIGKALNVRYMLSGTIIPENATYHITAMLTDTATAQEVWAAQFDPTRNRLSEVRDDIARHIASPLHIELDRLETARSHIDRPNNPDALDLFFRARSRLDTDTSLDGYKAAQGLLKQAIVKQPDFIDAQAELGSMLLRKALYTDDPDDKEDGNFARQLIEQVLASAPRNTKTLVAKARTLLLDGHSSEARRFAERALDTDSSSVAARTIMADCALYELRFDDAVTQLQRLLQLDPANPENSLRYLMLGEVELMRGSYKDAIDWLSRASPEKTAPAEFDSGDQIYLMLIAAYDLDGQQAKARQQYATYSRAFEGRTTWRVGTYFSSTWRTLIGYQHILAALRDSGMPEYADENEHGLPRGQPCPSGDFAPTPEVLDGGTVIHTDELIRLLESPKPPIVITVGQTGETPLGWIAWNPATTNKTALDFAKGVAETHLLKQTQQPVIISGDGVTGCLAFDTAKALVNAGYTKIIWYRGGREAWFRNRAVATALNH